MKNVYRLNQQAPTSTTSAQLVKPGLHISCKDRKHMVVNMYFKLHRYDLVSLSL